MIEILQTYLIPVFVVVLGAYFAFATGFFPLRKPKTFVKALMYRGDGDGSALKSLGVALAGTLGVGNIVGVVGAIALGGAGALFWMWISSFFAMMLKYAETVLAMKNRKKDKEGVHGGGMYYIAPKLLGRIFTILCLACSFVLGGAIQSSALGECCEEVLGISPSLSCGIMAALCFVVIIGGKKGIFKLAAGIVPIMSIVYALMCVAVIISRANMLPRVFGEIIKGAFSFKAAAGGGFFAAVKYGTLRGLISNEAGCGTAPIAHGASNNPSPSAQGCMGIAEVFIDTVVLCSLTGFCVLLYPVKSDGMTAVLDAFFAVFGSLSSYLLTVSVALFAFATEICWAFYGRECIHSLFPENKKMQSIYNVLFCISVYCLGFVGKDALWQSADLIIALMALINLSSLFRRREEILGETRLLFG
ncbi:MAG: alanine:cation symporter family protein [Ruminococcaceae bacterium]|nr:alanine:cation symporter family protein [Oscillospiraceae bacterium]